MTRRRTLLGLLLVLLGVTGLASPPPAARADADPPSDVLLLQDVYYPYQDDVTPQLHDQLDELTKRARMAGFPIKLALIATPADLGAIPEFYGHVERYTKFLETEIRYNRAQPLLVAMPTGYGTAATGRRGPAIVAALPPLHDPDANQMARGAVTAIARLAAANGHRLQIPPLAAAPPSARKQRTTAKRRGRSHTPLGLFFAPLAVIAVGALALAVRRRLLRRAVPAADAAPGEADEPAGTRRG